MQSKEPIEMVAPCPACGSVTRVGTPPRRHHASHNDMTYTLHVCPQCEFNFWSPLKADPSVYEDEGFVAYTDYHSGSRPFPRWAEPLFGSLPQQRGAALDIGCGDGSVLSRLAAAGFEPNGIDLDRKSVQVARQKFGLDKVVASTLDDYVLECRKHATKFDVITFFEVLEHQDAPREFLAQVRGLGNPGCVVAGSVPNRDRFLARLDRTLSDGDLPPHHFLWFSQRSLTRLLESAGFQNVAISRVGALSYAQIVAKLRIVISRKTSAWPRPMQFLALLLKLVAIVAAVVPWIGMRFAPSHLFFRCHLGDGSDAQVDPPGNTA